MVRKSPRAVKKRLAGLRLARYNRPMENAVRKPIAAGTFYPAQRDLLLARVSGMIGEDCDRRCAQMTDHAGLIAPHAGLPFSGPTAAAGYRAIVSRGRPDAVVLLGANHTGLGASLSVDNHDAWQTPIGDVPIDRALVDELADGGFSIDPEAFLREHSIEVHLPFLQVLWGSALSFVPICVQPAPIATLADAAGALALVLGNRPATLLVASTDFTHYHPDETARQLDGAAIDPILDLDSKRFVELYERERLSICGAGAIALLIETARRLGLDSTNLVDYSTSGDTSGDRTAVVGYAAITFFRRDHGS